MMDFCIFDGPGNDGRSRWLDYRIDLIGSYFDQIIDVLRLLLFMIVLMHCDRSGMQSDGGKIPSLLWDFIALFTRCAQTTRASMQGPVKSNTLNF